MKISTDIYLHKRILNTAERFSTRIGAKYTLTHKAWGFPSLIYLKPHKNEVLDRIAYHIHLKYQINRLNLYRPFFLNLLKNKIKPITYKIISDDDFGPRSFKQTTSYPSLLKRGIPTPYEPTTPYTSGTGFATPSITFTSGTGFATPSITFQNTHSQIKTLVHRLQMGSRTVWTSTLSELLTATNIFLNNLFKKFAPKKITRYWTEKDNNRLPLLFFKESLLTQTDKPKQVFERITQHVHHPLRLNVLEGERIIQRNLSSIVKPQMTDASRFIQTAPFIIAPIETIGLNVLKNRIKSNQIKSLKYGTGLENDFSYWYHKNLLKNLFFEKFTTTPYPSLLRRGVTPLYAGETGGDYEKIISYSFSFLNNLFKKFAPKRITSSWTST